MLGTELAVSMDICKDGCRPEKRDPCSSPPCKRLKQACIFFETVNSTKEIIIEPNAVLSNQATPTNTQMLPTNQHNPCQHGQIKPIKDHSDKTNPPIPSSTIDLKDRLPSDNTCKNNSGLNLPESTEQVKNLQNNSPHVAINKHGSILKFTKPVTPGHPQNTDVSKTPSKECGNLPSTPSTPVNHVVSPTTPLESDQVVLISPSPPPTPVNTPKVNTPRNRTPGRKVSVEERLKREEENLRKQKERENLEHERIEKKKEKERIKAEKEKEREEAKQKKEQERLEQLAQKKQREKERQEKKEQEDKEKKERLEKKEEERKKREDEKKKKEDEKTSKNEEKRKREEEQTLKKKKIQNHFSNFFIKKEVTSPKQKEQVKNETKFQPFEIKPGMKLASIICRKPLSEEAKEFVNKILSEQVATSIFQVKEELQKIKAELAHERQMREESKKNAVEIVEDDVMLIEKDVPTIKVDDEKAHMKAKLLLFHDNYRPAYFGTWRKKSSHVGPRTPFKKDMDFINYEVDSDEEWEEEEPGESLSNSEGEDEDNDNDGNNEEENDGENDGFFVPHGYLSDDEGVENVEDNEIEDKDATDGEKLPQHNDKVEDRMQRQLAKQKVWETEMKRQFKPMKPVAIGCIWSGEIPSILKRLEACHLVESRSIDPCMPSKDNQVPSSPIFNATAMPVPEEAMPALITLLHGNASGLLKLVQVFRKKWTMQVKKDETVSESSWEEHCPISKRQLERKITTIAKKERRSTMPKARWYVHHHILAQYKMEDIPLLKNGSIGCHIEQTSPVSKVGPFTPSIRQFTQNATSPFGIKYNGMKVQVKSCDTMEETPMDTSPV